MIPKHKGMICKWIVRTPLGLLDTLINTRQRLPGSPTLPGTESQSHMESVPEPPTQSKIRTYVQSSAEVRQKFGRQGIPWKIPKNGFAKKWIRKPFFESVQTESSRQHGLNPFWKIRPDSQKTDYTDPNHRIEFNQQNISTKSSCRPAAICLL